MTQVSAAWERDAPQIRRAFGRGRPFLPGILLFALLVTTLDAQSLWWDEGISLHLATSAWADVIADRAANIHPPMYFFALKLWVAVAGSTPFAARYPSALATMLLPAAVYRFLGRRLTPRAGRAAAWLVAFAPPFFIYGQEVRAYAFLPLLALALLAQVWTGPNAKARGGEATKIVSRGGALVGIQTALCLTHYAGVVAVAWANLVLFARLLCARDRQAWRAWWRTVGWTALLLIPWAIVVWQTGAIGLQREAGLGNAMDAPLPLEHGIKLLGIFHTLGLPQALADPTLLRPVTLVGGLTALGVLWFLSRAFLPPRAVDTKRSLSVLYLGLAWLVPLAMAPVIWSLSPQAHPRYLLPFILPLWLLWAVLVTCPELPRVLRGGLLASVLVMSFVGLRAYLTVPGYARSDARAAAALIRARAQPGDVVLIPHTDWSLPQYDLGAADWVMLPSIDDDVAIARVLADVTHAGQCVYTLDYRRGALDLRGQVSAALERGGMLRARHELPGVLVREYELMAPAIMPTLEPVPAKPVCVEEGTLCLLLASVQLHPESGTALPVALHWIGDAPQGRYAVAFRLYAPSGALVAREDTLLLDAELRATEMWVAGTSVTTYHLVPLPVGLLPQAYRLEVGLYDVATPEVTVPLVRASGPPIAALDLAKVVPAVAPWAEVSLYDAPAGPTHPVVDVARTVRLVGATLDRADVYPGQTLFAIVQWQPLDTLIRASARLLLRQNGRELFSTPLLAGLPPIPAGRPLLEHVALTVPPDAVDGPAQVVLLTSGGETVLGEVTVRAGEHTFIAPPVAHALNAHVGDVATLLGFEVARASDTEASPAEGGGSDTVELAAGEALTLTLVWRAGEKAATTNLTVFVHLMGADGSIVAQHDGKPVDGTRPTLGWVPGEMLVDHHTLTWQRDYRGPVELRVGLYNANTGLRAVWNTGEDALPLPLAVTVDGY